MSLLFASMRLMDWVLPPRPVQKETFDIEERIFLPTTAENAAVELDSCSLMLPSASKQFSQNIAISQLTEIMKFSLEIIEGHSFGCLSACLALLSIALAEILPLAMHTPWEALLIAALACIMVVFCFEFTVLSAMKKDYIWSIWFPLDLVALLTFLMDMPWFQRVVFDDECNMFSASSDHVARVGGTAAHAARVMRLVRALRLTRLVKVCKLAAGYLPILENMSSDKDTCAAARRAFQQLSGKSTSAEASHAADWVELTSD